MTAERNAQVGDSFLIAPVDESLGGQIRDWIGLATLVVAGVLLLGGCTQAAAPAPGLNLAAAVSPTVTLAAMTPPVTPTLDAPATPSRPSPTGMATLAPATATATETPEPPSPTPDSPTPTSTASTPMTAPTTPPVPEPTATPVPAEPEPTQPPSPPPAGQVSYSRDVSPIFLSRCVSCHQGFRAPHGLSLSSYQNIMKGSREHQVIVPGDPDGSMLWEKVRTDVMPLGGPPLDADQKAKIRDWIMAGAPNN